MKSCSLPFSNWSFAAIIMVEKQSEAWIRRCQSACLKCIVLFFFKTSKLIKGYIIIHILDIQPKHYTYLAIMLLHLCAVLAFLLWKFSPKLKLLQIVVLALGELPKIFSLDILMRYGQFFSIM
jgi:hypothetical protein